MINVNSRIFFRGSSWDPMCSQDPQGSQDTCSQDRGGAREPRSQDSLRSRGSHGSQEPALLHIRSRVAGQSRLWLALLFQSASFTNTLKFYCTVCCGCGCGGLINCLILKCVMQQMLEDEGQVLAEWVRSKSSQDLAIAER